MKNLFLLFTISIVALFASCSNEKDAFDNPGDKGSAKESPNYLFAYKTTPAEGEIESRAAVIKNLAWKEYSTITIKFLNGSTLAQQRVQEVSKQWLDHINLRFKFVDSSEDADVRIGFGLDGDQVSWSEVGTSCLNVRRQKPTMNLQLFEDTASEINHPDFAGIILREFGHMLGLINENLRSDSPVVLDENKTLRYFLQMGWDEDDIYDNFIDLYNARNLTMSDNFDENSIMLPYIPPMLSTNGIGVGKFNTTLSETDIEFIRELYPPYPGPEPIPGSVYMTMKTYTSSAYGIGGYDYDTESSLNIDHGIRKTYKTVTLGEYEWTTENLKQKYIDLWGTLYNFMNHTQAKVDAVTGTQGKYTVKQFEDAFGTWVTNYQEARSYRYGYSFYDSKESMTPVVGFKLPNNAAMLQLIGQAPVNTGSVYSDFAQYVYARPSDLGGNNFGTPHINDNNNASGLTMTPLGYKINSPDDSGAHYSFGYGLGLQMEEEAHMFIMSDAKGIEVNAYLYHFSQARYCRLLSDLDYEIYYNASKDNVVIIDKTATPASGYQVVPQGLERGIILRSNDPAKRGTDIPWSDVTKEASRIKSQIRIN